MASALIGVRFLDKIAEPLIRLDCIFKTNHLETARRNQPMNCRICLSQMRGEAISFHRLAYRALSQKGLQYFRRNRDWFEGELDPKFGSGSEKEKFVSSE